MKVAIYNLYWSTYGGGEQVAAAAAEHLLNAGHEVVVFGPEPLDIEMTTRRLGRDLGRCGYQRVTNDNEASDASASVDVFINCTYLSSAIPQSRQSIYYVHFPGVPLTSRRKVSSTLSSAGHRILSLFTSLPGPLEGVRAGFARRIHDVSWAKRYTVVAANSAFTAEWVQRLWGVDADILYPPVEVVAQSTTGGHLVMSLGRFFDRSFGHCKKQDVLLDAHSTSGPKLQSTLPVIWFSRHLVKHQSSGMQPDSARIHPLTPTVLSILVSLLSKQCQLVSYRLCLGQQDLRRLFVTALTDITGQLSMN